MIAIIVVGLLIITGTPVYCESMEYYVTPIPPPTIDCPPGPPCHTLDYYAQSSFLLSGQNDVSLLFLEGTHILTVDINIRRTRSLSLQAIQTSNNSVQSAERFIIECSYDCKIEFLFVTFLRIENIQITLEADVYPFVAASLVLNVNTAFLNSMILDGIQDIDITGKNIEINRSLVKNCFITARAAYYRLKNGLIEKNLRLSFSECNIQNLFDKNVVIINIEIERKEAVRLELIETHYGGRLLLKLLEDNNLTMIIDRCELSGTFSLNVIEILANFSANNNTVNLSLVNSKVTGVLGLSLYLRSTSFNGVNISIHNTTIIAQRQAVDLVMRHPDSRPDVEHLTAAAYFSMQESTFQGKFGVDVWVEIPPYVSLNFLMTITSCSFRNNNGAFDVVSEKEKSSTQVGALSSSFVAVTLRNVSVEGNTPSGTNPVIKVKNVNRMVIHECVFNHNIGTTIGAYFSDITLSGNTKFVNNTGFKGGALALYQSSIFLAIGANISFRNNYAKQVGGAIFVIHLEERPLKFLCFYLTDAERGQAEVVLPTINLWFSDNKALQGGDDIYGGALYSNCRVFATAFVAIEGRQFIDDMFHIDHNNSFSSVSSDPTRVCLCDDQGIPRCADVDYIYRELPPRYPGELFTVSAVVVGYDFGTVPGIVYANTLPSDGEASLSLGQSINDIKSHLKCTNIHFSIESPITFQTQTIKLTSQSRKIQEIKTKINLQRYIDEYVNWKTLDDSLLYHPVLLITHLEDCPVGFNLTISPPYICTCHPKLEENGISVCVITNHTGWVYRSGTIWVSASFTENETDSFVVHPYCPYDYCKQENISVDLRSPEKQCQFNHSGIMCGGCYGNLSLALGSSRCLPCDNRYVSLLLVFILAGLALVFFIKILDLTVAKGTINGLIFYANIVWANKSILFPATETLHPVQQILQTFIAWLNLDLGIEICFINGLDAYWKTWLQFVFPIYVWSITGIVIIASRYSTRASKIFGNNSVPVLATLILLSYAKLLRTIITVLGFSLLNYEQGTRIVWSFDGNVPYFGAAHTILFLVAIAALLLLWLPYTTVLLTLQWLRRKSYLKPLRWINRWKPFFDAYFGQLKPKHHHWVGVLLLVRVLLLTLFAVASAIVPTLNIVAIAFVGVFLFIHFAVRGMVYKLRSLSILEGSFILNLTSLAILKLYVHPNPIANSAVIYTSVGIVFVEFAAIVIYHTYSRIKSTYVTYKRRHTDDTDNVDGERRVVPPNSHNQIHYREPLLDSLVQDK